MLAPRQLKDRARISRALREKALQQVLDRATADPVDDEPEQGIPVREGIRAWG